MRRAYFQVTREEFSKWCLEGTNYEGGFVTGFGNDNMKSMVNIYFVHEKLKHLAEGFQAPKVKVVPVGDTPSR